MRRIIALATTAVLLHVAAVAAAQSPATQGPTATAGAQTVGAPAPASQAPATTQHAAEAASPDEPIDGGTYAVRLRGLEQNVNELKEQVFRSKARLSLLADQVLQGVVAGSQAVIVHENRMSASYRLVRAVYALDGAPIFNRTDDQGGLAKEGEFQVYNGSIVPGEHTLTVELEYQGHGYGIFSYLKGYRFKVRSTYSFNVPEGRLITLHVIGYEQGGPATPLEKRPQLRFAPSVTVPNAPASATPEAAGAAGDEGGK
ncbi:MAG: hypothetical protein KC543_01370 [Myxococcales bacterium]|nr:hypothetical protein [Myxococcales bacterium]